MSDHETVVDAIDRVALAGRAFRQGALVAACFVAGALCIVGVYAATVLLGGFLVRVITRFTP